jgi:hypothetical protein
MMLNPLPNRRFALTPAEREACARLFEHLETRIAALQRENELPQAEAQTAALRGQIKAFRELLNLREPPRIQELPPGR